MDAAIQAVGVKTGQVLLSCRAVRVSAGSKAIVRGVDLEVPASVPRWRTWAYTRHAKEPGPWRVEVRDSDGVLVGALPFVVEVAP